MLMRSLEQAGRCDRGAVRPPRRATGARPAYSSSVSSTSARAGTTTRRAPLVRRPEEVDSRAARERVRVARALEPRPSSAPARGELLTPRSGADPCRHTRDRRATARGRARGHRPSTSSASSGPRCATRTVRRRSRRRTLRRSFGRCMCIAMWTVRWWLSRAAAHEAARCSRRPTPAAVGQGGGSSRRRADGGPRHQGRPLRIHARKDRDRWQNGQFRTPRHIIRLMVTT